MKIKNESNTSAEMNENLITLINNPVFIKKLNEKIRKKIKEMIGLEFSPGLACINGNYNIKGKDYNNLNMDWTMEIIIPEILKALYVDDYNVEDDGKKTKK